MPRMWPNYSLGNLHLSEAYLRAIMTYSKKNVATLEQFDHHLAVN